MSASIDEEWSRLQRQLRYADGFWVGFVCASDPSAVNELRARAARAAPHGLTAIPVEAPEALLALLQGLEREAGGAERLLWVDAVHVGEAWEAAWQSFLLRANERRDRWRRTLPGGLVLAGPPMLRVWAREAAPDLWSVRSLVLDAEPLPRPDPKYLDVLRAASPPEDGRTTAADPAVQIDKARRLDASDPRRLALLTEAATALARGGRPNEALHWMGEVDRGGAQPPSNRARAEAWATIAEAEAALDPIGAEAHVARAIEQWGDSTEGTPLWWMGRAHEFALAAGDLARARAWVDRRVDTARRAEREAGAKVEARYQLAAALEQRGNLELRAGDAAAALAAHSAALEVRSWLEKNASGEGLRRNVALSLENVGRASWRLGDPVAAESAWVGAVARWRELLAEPDAPPGALEDLAIGLELLGDVRAARDAKGLAWQAFREALGQRLRFVRASGDPQNGWETARALRAKVAKFACARGDFAGEAEANEAAIDVLRAAVEADGAPVLWKRWLAGDLAELGYLRDITGSPAAAAAAFRESAERWREVIAVSGFERDAVVELAHSLARLADVQERMGDSAGALTSMEESVSLSRQRAAATGPSFGAPYWFFAQTVRLARVAAAAGDAPLARATLDAAKTLAPQLTEGEIVFPELPRRLAAHLQAFEALVTGTEPALPPPAEARCPRCRFDTDPRDGWSCRCGHEWNGWLRGGRCPTCGFSWKSAFCCFCDSWSPRSDWRGPAA